MNENENENAPARRAFAVALDPADFPTDPDAFDVAVRAFYADNAHVVVNVDSVDSVLPDAIDVVISVAADDADALVAHFTAFDIYFDVV